MIQEFKKRLRDGEAVFGPFMKTSDAAFVEIAGHAGFDFVILDMEHAPFTYANLHLSSRRGDQIQVLHPLVFR